MRCAEFFPYSTYFEGSQSSASPNSALNQICKTTVNGNSSHSLSDHAESVTSNGKVEAFKDLTIWQSRSSQVSLSFSAGYIKFWKKVAIHIFSARVLPLSWFVFLLQMCIILSLLRVEFFICSPLFPEGCWRAGLMNLLHRPRFTI